MIRRSISSGAKPDDGVICVAADAPLTAALVAERLKLPGISCATAILACDKLAMKQRFKERAVNVPWFAPLSSVAELEALIAERGPHLVIKPVDSRGSRGVQRLSVRAVGDVAEGVEAEFDGFIHGAVLSSSAARRDCPLAAFRNIDAFA